MLDEIRRQILELNAISTMLMDELTDAYGLADNVRPFEFDRIEDVLITSMSMVIDRIDSIDGIVDKLVDEKNNNAGGDKKWQIQMIF